MQCQNSFFQLQIATGIFTEIMTLIAIGISHISHFRMVFDAKRSLDSIGRSEGIASCLMNRITVAGYKVFKASCLH